MLREHGALQVVLPSLMGAEHNTLDKILMAHARVVDKTLVPEIFRYLETEKFDSERVFKLLFRFYKVFKAYQSKKKGWSRERCDEIWGKLQNTFLHNGAAGRAPGLGVMLNLYKRHRGDV